MDNNQNTTIDVTQLTEIVKACKEKNARLVAITAVTIKEIGVELTYSFDLDGVMNNVRITAAKSDTVPSITEIYPYAFLYENEIKELFGVNITDISVDFQGNLYQVAEKTAFNKE